MASPTKLTHDCARKLADQATAASVELWAKEIGLTRKAARFEQFRNDVTEALHACLCEHILEEYHWRWSEARKGYLRIAAYYAKVAELLRRGENVGLPPFHFDPRFKDLPPLSPPAEILAAALSPFGTTADFQQLAEAARRYADACVEDRGSRPKHFAFDALSRGLKLAFERAAERKATITRRDDRGEWDGDFFRLVEAVWPVACNIAEKVTGQPLPGPATTEARGKYLQRRLTKPPAE
jgi:hypothetical protein